MIEYLTLDDALALIDDLGVTLDDALALIDDLGVGPLRDVGLLDAALHRPQVTVFAEDAYPTLEAKAAVLMESLVRNHPLVDGNKRLGWLATVVFLGLNECRLEAPDDEAYDLVVGVASGQISYETAARQLRNWFSPGATPPSASRF